MLLSVIIEYLSKDDIKTLYDKIHSFILEGLKHQNKAIKLYSIKAITSIAKTTQNVKVLKNFQQLIPLILQALDKDEEDSILQVFSTFNTLVELKGVLNPYLMEVTNASLHLAGSQEFSDGVREQALFFIEQLPMNYSVSLKKAPDTLMNIIKVIMTVASEEDDNSDPFKDTPPSLALIAARSFAIHMKNHVIYPIFSTVISEALQHPSAHIRKAGILLLGQICESSGCLEPIKDNFDTHIDQIIVCLKDPEFIVRIGATQTIGLFSENVSAFVEAGSKIILELLVVMKELEHHVHALQKAFEGLHMLCNNMEADDILEIYAPLMEVLLAFLNHPSGAIK